MPANESDSTRDLARSVRERFSREQDRYDKLTRRVRDICIHDVVGANAIRATVSARTKEPSSVAQKVVRKVSSGRWSNDISVEDAFDRIPDLSAVRIATYVEADRSRIVDAIDETFSSSPDGRVDIEEKDVFDAASGRFYRATHCDVRLPSDLLDSGYDNLANLAGVRCEIQVTSMLAHVWNEVEHDLAYKPLAGALSREERDALTALGHLTIAADLVLQELYRATQRRLANDHGDFEDVFDFVARTRGWFDDTPDFGNHAGQLFDEIVAAGLTSPEALKDIVGPDPHQASAQAMASYASTFGDDPRAPELDRRSSDRLLVLFLDHHAASVAARHPSGRGRGRPPRIASIASRFAQLGHD